MGKEASISRGSTLAEPARPICLPVVEARDKNSVIDVTGVGHTPTQTVTPMSTMTPPGTIREGWHVGQAAEDRRPEISPTDLQAGLMTDDGRDTTDKPADDAPAENLDRLVAKVAFRLSSGERTRRRRRRTALLLGLLVLSTAVVGVLIWFVYGQNTLGNGL